MDELKAGCLALAQEALKPPNLFDPQSRFVLQKLERLLSSLNAYRSLVTPTVAEYVFFPIRSLLQQNSLGERQTQCVFEIVALLCDTAWQQPSQTTTGLEIGRAQQLLSVTTYLLCPDMPSNAKPTSFLSKSADFRAAGLNCLASLFSAAQTAGFAALLSRSTTSAQLITLILQQIDHNNDEPAVYLASLTALRAVLLAFEPDHAAIVLPGVVSQLVKVVKPSVKRHFKVKIEALKVLQMLIVKVTGNNVELGRGEKWIDDVLPKLGDAMGVVKLLMETLLGVAASRAELLNAIYELAQQVLCECSVILARPAGEIARAELVQIILLSASQQVDLELKNKASEALRHDEQTKQVLDHKLPLWIKTLPASLDTGNETRALTTLNSLQTTIDVLGASGVVEELLESALSALASPPNQKNPVIVQPAIASAPPVTELLPLEHETSGITTLSKLGVPVPMGETTQLGLARVLATVGRAAPQSLNIVLDRLQSSMSRDRIRRTVENTCLLWIASCLISDFAPKQEDIFDLVVFCYEDLARAMDVQTPPRGECSGAYTALTCYIIGQTASIEGPQIREFFVDLIHPLFAMLGSMESMEVRHQASFAISRIAQAVGMAPRELVLDNKDYLVDGMSSQLNTLNITPATFPALASLLYICGESIIPYLDDVFASLFVLMDHYHAYSALVAGILNAFRALAFVTDKSLAGKRLIEDAKPALPRLEITDLESLLIELHRKPKIDPEILDKELDLNKLADNLDKREQDSDDEEEEELEKNDENTNEEESDNEDIVDEPEQAVEKWEYPVAKPTYKILQRIAGYCDRLMTHESSEIRTATLQVVSSLIPFLAVNKEEFLPLVHKTWPEALERVFDPEVFVVEQGFACLGAVAQFAQSFVTSRLESVWPRLMRHYEPLLRKRWPQFAPERRLTNSFISFVETVLGSIPDLPFSVLEKTLVACRPALLRNEVPRLRAAIENASPSAADLLWLVLLDQEVKPSQEGFYTIQPVYT